MNGFNISQGKRELTLFLALLAFILILACSTRNTSLIGISESVTRANELFQSQHYDAARQVLIEASQDAGTAQERKDIAKALSNGGNYLFRMGRLPDAEKYYRESMTINKKIADTPELIVAYSYLGKIASIQGNYRSAKDFYYKALSRQRKLGDKAGVAHNLNNLANILSIEGEYVKALDNLQEALRLASETSDLSRTARTSINLAALHFNFRNYQQAMKYVDSALDIADDDLKALALKLRGAIYRQQGDFQQSRKDYKNALQIIQSGPEHASLLRLLGELYKEEKNYTQALIYLEKALKIYIRSGDKLRTAMTQDHIGEVQLQQNNYVSAEKSLVTARNQFERIGYRDGTGRVHLHLGHVYGMQKKWPQASKNFDKAIDVYTQLNDPEWLGLSYFGRGRYAEDKGDLAKAELDYREAVELMEQVSGRLAGGEAEQQIFKNTHRQLYEHLIRLLMSREKEDDAGKFAEQYGLTVLREEHEKNFKVLFRKKKKIETLKRELAKEKRKPQQTLGKIEHLIKVLAETKQELKQEIKNLQKDPYYGPLYIALQSRPDEMLFTAGSFPDRFASLVYFVTDKETFVFVFGKAVSVAARIELSRTKLSDEVTTYLEAIRECQFIPASQLANMVNATADQSEAAAKLSRQAQNLYAYLIAPIEKYLNKLETLAIVSDGPLHSLPFHALAHVNSDGNLTFLLKEKRIVYLWNTAFLTLLLDRSKNHVYQTPESIVAFADPDLGDPKLSLPFARSEVETIKGIFPGTKEFVGPDATKNNFRNTWGQYEIVHIAAHTKLTSDGPLVMLAPADTGALNNQEIVNLQDTDGTRFVVLSGCETAVSNKNPDKNQFSPVASVALSFLFARAHLNGVIGTLWPIVDGVQTTDLMKAFYANLKNGITPYQALYQAQLEMIDRDDIRGQPYYWAPFVVYGSWL